MKSSQRIAIVGSGISGLTAAHHLARAHDVTLFEANDYIGGHTHTVEVEVAGGEYSVDTGFIVCNDRNYPEFLALMEKIGVGLNPTEMSFSVANPELGLEYNGHNLNTLFAQRRNLLRPAFLRLVRDILRFNDAARAAYRTDPDSEATLGEFIGEMGLGPWCRDNYLLPMVAAIWSCSESDAAQFPLSFFLRFFLNHGLLDIRNRPQWYVLQGGSHSYIPALTRDYADNIRLNAPVTRVKRTGAGVEIDSNGASEIFDHVILACHSDQALALLEQPTRAERNILGAIPYQDNDVTLHTDATLMPKRRLAWASWNFLSASDTRHRPPVVTYCMNILQGLAAPEPVLVSLNARDRIREDKILGEYRYAHPGYTTASLAAQARRSEICGADRIHFCGAYWYNGFHEDGVHSALDLCPRFGVSP